MRVEIERDGPAVTLKLVFGNHYKAMQFYDQVAADLKKAETALASVFLQLRYIEDASGSKPERSTPK